ncbi:MAG: carbon-nitrogen hydrolase family protein [Pirellulaceae bacterium]
MSARTKMPVRNLRLAVGQMLVEGGKISANLDRAETMIRRAASEGCAVVVLPECLDVGWTNPHARTMAESIPGPRMQQLARAAADQHIFVVAGLTERDGDRIYNSAVLLDDRGQLLLCHRKINELDIAQDLYAIGDRLQVAHTSIGVLGINICADNFPNALDIGRTLGRMGAQILLSPSAWAVTADHDPAREPYGALWQDAYGQLARAFQMPVVGASNVGPIFSGPWTGRKCIGCSLVVGAEGEVVAIGPYQEPSLIVADVTLHDDRPAGTAISGQL